MARTKAGWTVRKSIGVASKGFKRPWLAWDLENYEQSTACNQTNMICDFPLKKRCFWLKSTTHRTFRSWVCLPLRLCQRSGPTSVCWGHISSWLWLATLTFLAVPVVSRGSRSHECYEKNHLIWYLNENTNKSLRKGTCVARVLLESSEIRGNQVKLPSAKLHVLVPTHSADCVSPTLTGGEGMVVGAEEEKSSAGDGSCITYIYPNYVNSRWVGFRVLLSACQTLLLLELTVLHHHRTKLHLIGFFIRAVPVPMYSMVSTSQWRGSIASFLRKIAFDTAEPAKGTSAKHLFCPAWSGLKSRSAVSWISWRCARQERS